MPARPMTLSFVAFSRIFGGNFCRRANGKAIKIADDRGELVLVLAEAGLEIDFDAAILEDGDGGGRKGIGNEDALGMEFSDAELSMT